jgi:hypothetical protein
MKKSLLLELKRHKQLLEYDFYTNEKEEDLNGQLLLDEQDPVPGEGEDEFPVDDLEDPSLGDLDLDLEPPTDETPPTDFAEPPVPETPMSEPTMSDGETIELDVTDLVTKSDETKSSVDGVSTKMDDLLSKLSDLESQITGMDTIINKIDGLEKEIEKRNPTPIEKLEMRSLSSFPYSVKLTDFWSDKEGYEATEEEDEDYVLKQSDVNNFDERSIKSSFNSTNEF